MAEKESQPIHRSREIRRMINNGSFLEAGQEIRDQLSAELQRYFIHIFGDPDVKPVENHFLIPEIALNGVITSNYDRLVESAYTISTGGSSQLTFTQHDYDVLTPQPLRSNRFFILKAHGDYQRISTVVLGTRDYQELQYQRPGYRDFLECVFATNTVIFIGYGGTDPDFRIVSDKLAAFYPTGFEPHYIILPAGSLSLTQKDRLLHDQRLRTIEYRLDAEHSELRRILRELVKISHFKETVQPAGRRVLMFADQADEVRADEIGRFLDREGHSVFRMSNTRAMQSAQQDRLKRLIETCETVLFLVSRQNAHLLHVGLPLAEDLRKIVVPVVLDSVTPPQWFRTYPYLRLREDSVLDGLRILLSTVGPQ